MSREVLSRRLSRMRRADIIAAAMMVNLSDAARWSRVHEKSRGRDAYVFTNGVVGLRMVSEKTGDTNHTTATRTYWQIVGEDKQYDDFEKFVSLLERIRDLDHGTMMGRDLREAVRG